MTAVKLTDNQWTEIRDFLLQVPNAYVGNEANCYCFIEAVKRGRGGFATKIHVTVAGNPGKE